MNKNVCIHEEAALLSDLIKDEILEGVSVKEEPLEVDGHDNDWVKSEKLEEEELLDNIFIKEGLNFGEDSDAEAQDHLPSTEPLSQSTESSQGQETGGEKEKLPAKLSHFDKYFGPSKEANKLKCKKCQKDISYNPTSNYGVKNHYKNMHPADHANVLAAISGASKRGRCWQSGDSGSDISPAHFSKRRQTSIEAAFKPKFDQAKSLDMYYSHDVSASAGAEPQSPWPFLDKWLKYKKMVSDNYIFQCLSCLPKINEVRVNKGTKANLKSHFNRIHPDAAKQVYEACKANVSTGGRGRNRSDGGTSGSASSKRPRYMSIAETFGLMAQGSDVLQSHVDKTIVAFVVDNMLPFQIVDSQSFRTLVRTLNPNKEVPSRRTLGRRLIDMYQEMKEGLIKKLKDVKWVSTTADCWSANKKGYLGMTVHWLDPETRERNMGVLACERLKGSHTHEVLARAMNNIHIQFGIEEKVTMTITDNAANFKKAFVVFASVLLEKEEVPLPAADPADAQLQELIADPPEDQGQGSLEFIAFEDLEEEEDANIKLPRQQKCGAHTLNLVASTDIDEKDMPIVFKKAYRSAIAKAKSLWNKQGTSTVFADNLQTALKKRLTVSTDTRWNSLYDSLLVLNKVLEEQKGQLQRCMNQQMNLTVFDQADIDFMAEYTKVMAPVASALEQIQGEKQGYLGCLIPTLVVAKKKLVNLQASGNLRFCVPLVEALLLALDMRFGATFDDEECLLASAFHPKFRLKWMGAFQETRDKRPEGKTLMEKKVEEYLRHQDLEMASNARSTDDMDADDYYSSIIDEDDAYSDETGGQTRHRSARSKAVHIVKLWLEAKITDSLADTAFNSEKALIDLFVRYNTAMPSSAAVERLFSLGKDINRAKRSSLSDESFSMLMFTKGNMNANHI